MSNRTFQPPVGHGKVLASLMLAKVTAESGTSLAYCVPTARLRERAEAWFDANVEGPARDRIVVFVPDGRLRGHHPNIVTRDVDMGGGAQ